MSYNQISSTGAIISATNPPNISSKEIREYIYQALNLHDCTFTWIQKHSQPYQGILNDGEKDINLYIYAWNMTPAYRTNPSEKRIQIQAAVNNVGIDRPISDTEKTIILGLYNSPTGAPLFVAWDTTVNRGRSQKSCYVQIEDVARALTDGTYKTTDRNNAPIYTMTQELLGDYVSLLKSSNTLRIATPATPTTLLSRVKNASRPSRKKRAIRTIAQIQSSINSLTTTEKEVVCKQRIGQGLFKDLLIEKYSCKCALCDIDTKRMLIGSHIKTWADSNDTEKLDENNGLLLCAHHDALFDKYLISFDDDGTLLVSPTLNAAEQNKLHLSDIPVLTVTPEMKPYLTHHRSKLRN